MLSLCDRFSFSLLNMYLCLERKAAAVEDDVKETSTICYTYAQGCLPGSTGDEPCTTAAVYDLFFVGCYCSAGLIFCHDTKR